MIVDNPYIVGNPVGGTFVFTGRRDILQAVLRVLRNPYQNAITLFGQRRIGKSSVLIHLMTYLPEQGPYRVVYYDLQDKSTWSLGQLLGDLARKIAATLGIPEPDMGSDPEKTFHQVWLSDVLERLSSGEVLVLLFDEFDALADPKSEKQAGATFFPYLRDLLSVDLLRLQFVFALGRNVSDMSSIAMSLFKGVESRRVSLLEESETRKLVAISEMDGVLQWNPEAVQEVWNLTHGHPYLIEGLCYYVLENVHAENDGQIEVLLTDVQRVVDETLEASRNHLQWLWEGMGPAEKIVAAALAQAGSRSVTQEELENILRESGVRVLIRELLDAPELLQEWDLLEPTDGGYCFRVEMLRRWIMENKPLRRVQDELERIQPAADVLFQAANKLYMSGSLEEVEDLLRRAIVLNPNHLRANELLAQILLSHKRLDEAQLLLERLLRYYPAPARPILVETYLAQAQVSSDVTKQGEFYDKILQLEPGNREAYAGRVQILSQRAEVALSNGELEIAHQLFQQAGLAERATSIQMQIDSRFVQAELEVIQKLEVSQQYSLALDRAQQLAQNYPTAYPWQDLIQRLERENGLADLYQSALIALQQSDRDTAIPLLIQIVNLAPDYAEATRYLHLAVTKQDFLLDKKDLRLTDQIIERLHNPNIRWYAAGGIVIVLFFVIIWGGRLQWYTAATATPPALANPVQVLDIYGTLYYQIGSQDVKTAIPGSLIAGVPDMRVWTTDDGLATLKFFNDSVIKLGANTSILLGEAACLPNVEAVNTFIIEDGNVISLFGNACIKAATGKYQALTKDALMGVHYDDLKDSFQVDCFGPTGTCQFQESETQYELEPGQSLKYNNSVLGTITPIDYTTWEVLGNVVLPTLISTMTKTNTPSPVATETLKPTFTATVLPPPVTFTPTETYTMTPTLTPTTTFSPKPPKTERETPVSKSTPEKKPTPAP